MNGPTFATIATAPTTAPRPAPPRPVAPARPGPRPDTDGGGGMRVLTYLRLHWLMILFCGTLLGGAGAYAAWELLPSKFESYALLQVSSVPSSLGNQNNPNQARTDFVTYLKTTSALIKSEFVLNAALRDIKDLPTIRDQQEPIKFLDEEVQVNWQDGSEVVRIVMKGHNPADTKRIVDSVQKAFMAEVIETEIQMKRDFMRKVETARDEMKAVLDKKAPAKGEKPNAGTPGNPLTAPPGAPVAGPPAGPPEPLPPVAPPLVGAPAAPGPAPQLPGSAFDTLVKLDPKILTTKLVGLYNRIEELPVQIVATRKEIMGYEAKLKIIQGSPIDPNTKAMVDKDMDVVALQRRVYAAQQAYIFVSGNSTDPNAPTVRERRAELQAEREALDKLRDTKINQFESNRRMLEARPIAMQLEAALKKLDQLETQYRVAKEQLVRAEKQLSDLPLNTEKGGLDPFRPETKELYDPARTDLMTTDSLFSRLVQQYYLTQMELKSPPRVRILQPASTPMQKDMRKQVLGTVFAGLMGYAIIALGVVAFETLTRRVSSLADLKSAGPAPVVGVIPCQPEEAVGRDQAKRAAANEAIDKLRAYVTQSWLSRGATTVAVTSPLGDEGKAFTAFGLASSLAQAGYRTLVVDFDLRDPALHAYAGVPNQTGVCEILRAEIDPRSAVQHLPSGLHLITAGKWSDEARKAAVGGKLEALLAALREPYDCVVLHGHALLTVAESVEVARRCEVVLVCARYRETKVPLLRKATDRLAAMEIPYSGVVYVGATEQEALC